MQSTPNLSDVKALLMNAPKKKTIMLKGEPTTFTLELTAEELLILKNVHVDYINDGDMEQLSYDEKKVKAYDGISKKLIELVKQAGL